MTLAASLTQLETTGLIRLAQMEPELEYFFRHALIQDATYESILKADRRLVHRAIGETLERMYPKQLSELAPTLGQHFAAAGEAERARQYFMRAGDNALAAYANIEAEQHYRAALTGAASAADKADALSGLGRALNAQSRFEEAIQAWREAIGLYHALKDDDNVARLYARSARAAWFAGDIPRGLALCREGLGAVAEKVETLGMAALLHEAARACYFNGLPDEGYALCQQALEIAERVGDVETQTEALITLGGAFDAKRQFDEAVDIVRRAAALAEAAGLLSTAARAHNNLGAFFVGHWGDIRAGRDHLLRTVELDQQRRAVDSEVFSLAMMAWASTELGDFAEADEFVRKARQILPMLANPNSYALLLLRSMQAALLMFRGDWQAASQSLRACQGEARQKGNLDAVLEVGGYLAETLLELGEWEEAGNVASEALALNERGVAVIFSIWSRHLLITARGRQGRLEEARRLLAAGRTQVGQHPTPIEEQHLSLAEARLATIEGRWPEALATFEATARLQAQIGRRWYRAQTLREWAEAHLKRNEPGDVDRARELLREAQSEFEAMNVPKHATLASDRLAPIG